MRWLITGASGSLGSHLVAVLRGDPSIPCSDIIACTSGRGGGGDGDDGRDGPPQTQPTDQRPVTWQPCDLCDPDAVRAVLAATSPTIVIHAAAVTNVGLAFRDPDVCRRTNVEGTAVLAAAAEALPTCKAVVVVSTDMVFDGTAAPYDEQSPTAPLSVYGRSKADGEAAAVAAAPSKAVVCRVPLLLGVAHDRRRALAAGVTFRQQLEAMRARCRGLRSVAATGEMGTTPEADPIPPPVNGFADEHRTPLWYRDAAHALVALALLKATERSSPPLGGLPLPRGTLHVAGRDRASRVDILHHMAAWLLLPFHRDGCSGTEGPIAPNALVAEVSRNDFPGEPRAADLALSSGAARAALKEALTSSTCDLPPGVVKRALEGLSRPLDEAVAAACDHTALLTGLDFR